MADKKAVEYHRSTMSSPAMRASLDAALLEYQHQVCLRTEVNMAGMGHFKMMGAREFVNELLNLAESTPELSVVRDRDNLQRTP